MIVFIEEKGGKAGVLRLEGDITIQQAEELKENIIQGLGSVDKLYVDSSNVSAIDLSGLQLLCAAHRAAITLGKTFHLAEPVSSDLRRSAEAAGFARHTGCMLDAAKTCIWAGLFGRSAVLS